MENTFEKAYTPREVKTTLDISDSALRKWCLALERNGYKFIRNDKKNRIFSIVNWKNFLLPDNTDGVMI